VLVISSASVHIADRAFVPFDRALRRRLTTVKRAAALEQKHQSGSEDQ